MGLFVCAKCNTIENTALGHYWSHNYPENYKWTKENEQFKGKPLCSECMPTEFSNGHLTGATGKWHGRWPKQDVEDFLKSEEGKHYHRNNYTLTYIN